MAREYVRALKHLGKNFTVIGRSVSSARKFEDVAGVTVRRGGLTVALDECGAPGQALVAVGIDQLSRVAIELIEAGARRILLEKPGGLNTNQIKRLRNTAIKYQAEVFVAYNRRFYASTQAARKLISDDGGALSCVFEFTEWSHLVLPMEVSIDVKNRWFLANSTHVVDLAFHLCGFPKDWRAWRNGSLEWHKSAARFSGSGVTDLNVLFSYHADWEGPGRWGLEVLTQKHRYIFRPMEQLHVVKLGSVQAELVNLSDKFDKEFKPGVYMQTKAFLEGDNRWLCTIDEQLQHCAVYDKIAGY